MRHFIHPKALAATAVLALAMLAAAAEPVQLFNGRDLTGWSPYLWDNEAKKEDTATPPSAVWSVEDGVLICKGEPSGYIRTNDEFENYRLSLEWRWPAGTGGGNNGVLVHTTTPNALNKWPKSIEVQLYKDNAGDFWEIGTTVGVPNEETRQDGRRHINLTDGSEKPIGEWNKMEILCQGEEIKVWVNGDFVNHATSSSDTRGAIALQSEGAVIHYRNVILTPLD